jgi:RNA polymerase sigma factor (sigma-70 family)
MPNNPHFAATRWTLVLQAGHKSAPNSTRALAELCSTYWHPLYAYARRRGHNPDDARDLTQSFFTMLLEKGTLGLADPARGRFRTFLLSAMQNFLAGEWRKQQAQKRGGAMEILSLDFESAEESYAREPSHNLNPEAVFERRWALSLVERAVTDLREQYAAAGNAKLFDALKPYLVGDQQTVPYAELAEQFGRSQGTLRTAVSRLRSRWGGRIRDLVAETVKDESEVHDELRKLIASLGESV